MALFSFTDIKFKTNTSRNDSSNALTENNQYRTNTFRYPIDLGVADKGHYVVIHVNQQKQTAFQRPLSSDYPTVWQNRLEGNSTTPFSQGSRILGEAISEVENLVGTSVIDKNDIADFSTGFLRTIQRTTDTIALYMPDTVQFQANQQYDELNLTGLVAAGATTAMSLQDILKNAKAGSFTGVLGNLAPMISYFANQQNITRAAFTGFTGRVTNPLMEVIYSTPRLREFRFDFMFYPRSEIEAKEVQKIIKRLQFHQAPEIDIKNRGFFLVPPSEFDIKFYYNGAENLNVPRISTCVMTSFDVDYAPNGWSAYEVMGENKPEIGRTGMPVAIRLSLGFKETEVITKQLLAGDENNGELRTQAEIDYSNSLGDFPG
jgi:hypothetical protein